MRNPRNNKSIGIDAEKLRTLAEELKAIAFALTSDDSISEIETLDQGYTDIPPINNEDKSQIFSLARNIYRSRRTRTRVFSDNALFGEPAWDMLLDLFIAEADGKQLSVTAACIGAAVPTSTALRWLVILEDRGLVRRENDPRDARRVFLHLTSEGYDRMIRYFQQLQREGLQLG